MDFRLLRAHMHNTPTHARWSCGKIFVLTSKRTNFRTDEKKTLYGIQTYKHTLTERVALDPRMRIYKSVTDK